MIYQLIFLQFLTCILLYYLSKKSLFWSKALVTIAIAVHLLVIGYSPKLLIRDLQNQYRNTRDPVTFSLDRCSSHIPLRLCRILYNKPTLWATIMFQRFLAQYSEENILNFLIHPYRSFFALFFYVGIVHFFLKKSPSHLETTFLYWIFLYGCIGVLQIINPNIVYSAFIPAIFFVINGIFIIRSLCTAYGKK